MNRFFKSLIASAVLVSFATPHSAAYAHASDPSALSIAIPVVVVASAGVGASAAVTSAVALPAAVSVAGATLVVKSVEVSATGVVCVLERASDGARVSLEFAGRSVAAAAMSVGATMSVTIIASGAIVTHAGEAIAFIPNAIGRALTHNERM
jgi:hypothetical protein